MKLIYLFEQRLPYENDNTLFGYDIVRKYGWDIEVWCLLGMTCNVDTDNLPKGLHIDQGEYIKFITTIQEFDDCLNSMDTKEAFFLCYPYDAYDRTSYYIRKKMYEYKFRFANVAESPSFSYTILKKVPFGITQAIKHLFRRYILGFGYFLMMWVKSLCSDTTYKKKFIDCFFRLIGPIKYPSYCNFITTELAYYFVPQPFCKWLENNFLLHSTNYSLYLREIADKKQCSKDEYIVFIDQGLINRDEVFLAMGSEIPIKNPSKYIADLNNLFLCLEKDYGCEVVIAAHPKASYSSETFNNRKIIFGETATLIKNAKLVINQFSAAFYFAVLFKKDFIDIYTKEMWLTPKKEFKLNYKGFELINCESLDISNYNDVKNYKKYICKYEKEKFKVVENVGIIDNNSKYRTKLFYEYVCEIINDIIKKDLN